MIIDAYNHILPKKYQETLEKKVTSRDPKLPSSNWAKTVPTLMDLEARFRIMDAFDGYIQVISIASPPAYAIAPAPVAIELSRIANDELAELVQKYPERFAAGVATLPMNDPEAAVAEAERAIKDLRLRGVEVYTDIAGKPLDAPEFMPFYEKMEKLGRPIFIHPRGLMSTPDYEGEEFSKYRLWTKLGWPYATAMAVCRLVYSGVIEQFPGLKVVTHHCGGIIPYLAGRLDWADDVNEMLMGQRDILLKEHALVYFRRIFYDTAVSGNTGALQCARAFAGVDQMVFGTDVPFGNQLGRRLIRQAIEAVERMGLSDEEKRKIYRDNAIKLLRLPLGYPLGTI
ncbi:MAG: amidohydrolase [Deltaproteobacteria bacterium]|nr:MAG: amidohydrolase [Deltaproteobacteria bacterium]